MKILRLRLKNLNSLREADLDFTASPLADASLFAITGPTGAGKTTLLDAITLALFGRAARYGTTSNPDSVMSRHTGECSAEVDFRCPQGDFRATWTLHRARKRPVGELQMAKRILARLPDESIVAERTRECDAKIVELTGLDYDRFLRSILLAQGDFAKFLQADVKDRVELLEAITGTGIYREISRQCHEKEKAARLAVDDLANQQGAIQILRDDERVTLQQSIVTLEQEITTGQQAAQALQQRVTHARRWQELEKQVLQLGDAQRTWQVDADRAQPELVQLAAHQRALPAAPDLQTQDRLTREQGAEQAALDRLSRELPDLEKAEQTATCAIVEAEQQRTARLHRRQQEEEPLWAQVGQLDQRITLAQAELREKQQQAAQAEKAHAERQKQVAQVQAKLATAQQGQAAQQAWLDQHAPDAGIAEVLPELTAALSRWQTASTIAQDKRKELTTAEQSVTKQQRLVDEATAKLTPLQTAVERARQAEQAAAHQCQELGAAQTLAQLEAAYATACQHRERIDRLGREATLLRQQQADLHQLVADQQAAINARDTAQLQVGDLQARHHTAEQLVEALEKVHALAQQVQSLEQHRATLADGQPCPLCGATEHPYAQGHSAGEVSEAARNLKAAKTALKKIAGELTEAKERLTTAATRLQGESTRYAKLHPQHDTARAAWDDAAQPLGFAGRWGDTTALADALAQADARATQTQQALAGLRLAQTAWQTAKDALQQAASALQTQQGEVEKRAALHAQLNGSIPVLREQVVQAEKTLAESQSAFAALIGTLAPVPATPAEATPAVAALKARATTFAERQKQHQQLAQDVVQLEANLAQQRHELASAERAFGECRLAVETSLQTLALPLAERRAKFGDQAVEAARQLSDRELAACAQRLDSAKAAQAQAHTKVATARETRQGLEARLGQRRADLETLARHLLEMARAAGFEGLESMRAALLDAEIARRLEATKASLEQRQTRLQSQQETLQQQRAALPPEAVTDAPRLHEIEAEANAATQRLNAVNQQLGALRGQLAHDDAQRLRHAGFKDRLEAARSEHARWHALRELIGSADGSRFAQFAQGLTLERLTLLANRHLQSLNPRYSLRRAGGTGQGQLEMEIVDHYQADVTRPTRSLSGGETFLASLALALGLSELAAGNNRIESLFIDEGFGTLDADTLETVMAALESLQASGKTIGVISHVAAMQERIRTQVRLLKRPTGHSQIEVVG